MIRTCFLLFFFKLQIIYCQDLALKQALNEIKNNTVTSSRILNIENALVNVKNENLEVEGLTTLGKVYYGIEKYDKSLEKLSDALTLAFKINEVEKLGNINEGLGNLYFKLGNYQKCDSFYKVSLHYFKLLNNKDRIIKAKGNLAIMDIKNKKYSNALQTFNEILEEDLDPKSKAIVFSSIGNLYLEQKKDISKAILFYNKAIALLKGKEHNRFLSSLYQNIAEAYIYNKEYLLALDHLRYSEKLLQTVKDKELNAALYKFYAGVYEQLGQYKLSLQYYKLFFEENTKVEKSKNTWLIENQEINNQLKSNVIEKENAKQKIKILKAEKSLATAKMYVLILAFVLLCLMVYLILKKQKAKITSLSDSIIESQDKLKYTEHKAEKIILNVNHTQDYMINFTDQLKEIYSECSEETIKKKLLEILQEAQNTKIPNQKNEELLQNLTSSFVYNLEKYHPDLTTEEIKIAELIFLGYKNKEIATMQNLSVRSIENCRYRIRKKFNLETTKSLSTYLQSLSQ